MIKVLIVLICSCLMFSINAFGGEQEYQVIYTIKYNAITLEKAAEIDRQIRKQYDDSCNVDIEVEEANNNVDTVLVWSSE